jgi:hypothetical protein
MNKMDKFAAVVVDFDDGSTHRGTGYALTAERIITARHLIVPDSGENPVKIRVYWEAIAAMVEATVVETLTQTLDPDYDVLLLACTVPPEVQHAGYLLREHPDRSVKWQSRGYARVGEERCVAVGGQTVKLRESTLMQGASFEGGHQDNILVLAAVGKVDVPEHWCGVSGAPVFLDGTDSIMGVLVASPQGFAAGRLCATPMWSLMAEQAFTTALGFDQHYDALAELKDEVAWLLSEHADVCDLLRRQLCPQAVQAEDVADTLTQQVKLESLIKACSSLANKSIKRNHQPQADVLLKLLNHLLPLCFDPAVVHRVSHATSAVCSVDIANNTAAAVVMAAMGKRAVQFRQHVGDREPTGICYLENPALDAVLGIEERVTIFSTELTHRFSGIDQLHPNQAKELKDLISYAVTFLECEAEEGRIYYFLYVLEKSPSEQHEQIMIFERVKALFPPIVFLGISSAPESINRDRKLFYHLNKLYAPNN